MGLVQQVHVIWLLLNLCIIGFNLGVAGSSGLGEPISLASSFVISSVKAQAPPINQPGLIEQPPPLSSSSKSPEPHLASQGPLPFQTSDSSLSIQPYDSSTHALAQAPHESAPTLSAETPYGSAVPVAKPPPDIAPSGAVETPFEQQPNSTPPPVGESQHDPVAPSIIEPPKHASPPSVIEPPHAYAVPREAKPPNAADPLPTAKPPKVSPFEPTPWAPSFAVTPPPSPNGNQQHTSYMLSPPMSWQTLSPPSQLGPSVSPSRPAVPPSVSSVSPPLMLPLPMEPPPLSHSPPPADKIPLHEPPPPNGDTVPFKLSPPFSPLFPGAEPPHSSSVPLPTMPPGASTHIPATQPPQALTSTPLPVMGPLFPSPSPASTMQPPPVVQNASSSPSLLPPSNASSPLYELVPPIASSLPPQSTPLNASSPPPQSTLLNASSPLPPQVPHASPPNPSVPPSTSNPPPLMVPPPFETPPLFPSPFPALPPNASSLPPPLEPPYDPSPRPQVNPPPASFPPVPPSTFFPPPLMMPPPLVTPPLLPSPSPAVTPNASSLPPQFGPPYASSPPGQTDPPLASPPTPILPSIPLISPPLKVPPSAYSPPILPPPSLAMPPGPPHDWTMMSPPIPSHALSPLPQVAPPHLISPPLADSPQVFFASPPIKLPSSSPPPSSNLPESAPPYASSPPRFLSPPPAVPPSGKPSHPSKSPPVMVPSHAFSAPPPSQLSYHSISPSPTMKETAVPPHSSQRKVTMEGSPPPSLTRPETPPPSGTSSRAGAPVKSKNLESPSISHEVNAPEHNAPSPRLNASEPHGPLLPAPAPRNYPVNRTAQSMTPPTGAPGLLSPAHPPRRAPSEPKFERQNGRTSAPLSFQVSPPINGSHHSHHSTTQGSPMALIPSTSPSPSPQGIPELSSAPPGLPDIPFLSPKISPSGSPPRIIKKPRVHPIQSLPPPPPNTDCASQTCNEPYTNRPPGSPCGCVWPMQVGLRLNVPLYNFFPLAIELAKEIASGVFLKQSQVRVMGASPAAQETDDTIVIVNLVPLEENFDSITSHLISDRFWQKQVIIDKSIFGDYDVLYVRYPGLPPSPPMAPADIAVINGMPYSVGDPNGSKIHPLGVDVTKQRHKHRLSAIIIAVIALSAVLGLLICCSVAWILVFRHTSDIFQPTSTPRALASLARPSGPTALSTGSAQSSSLSFGSNLAPYTGSAKTFSASELEKATNNFNPSNILGEGGFGLVYSGVLDEETKIAVKVLKRDDQQGGREFLAEVEMLSRLHHRNLVRLIGICIDERMRCLVYELIPNGSVESHLHGPDKEVAPLDWPSRMKIALGAARGLAYLHEDSSPRVIHRDFKASNILLETDFTPKVSDFGLARNAMDEENRHISTRVMGTFGYVAPEYAMTGHLLVKSDVYSYGVVLLELLTGRKPVDMTQPAGLENLATWTRPLLASKEGLESILDPCLGSNVPFESVAKVAAIASMCVQPEVTHRPFMGEVVQALKLVCDECDDSRDGDSRNHSHDNLSIDFDAKVSPVSGTEDPLQGQFTLHTYTPGHDVEKGLSVSEVFNTLATLDRQSSDSFRRHSASGPLRTEKGRKFWQRMRRTSQGSESERGVMYRLWAGSH